MKSTIKKIISAITSKISATKPSFPQQQLRLYENGVPNSRKVRDKEHGRTRDNILRIYKVSDPCLLVFTPEKPNGKAVIVCPGGSYAYLTFDKEGTRVAEEIVKWGITVFVLKYRLPDDAICIDKSLAPLQDVQQAMRLVRSNAEKWNVDKNKIGIMGFSAGGHVASSLATHFEFKADPANNDTVSLRPNFNILIYPVMNMNSNIAHAKSRDNLTGKDAEAKKLDFFSNELQVTPHTPPSFLVHAEDDESVPVINAVRFYDACIKNNVPAEIHLYPQGGHGFGMINKTANDRWMDKLKSWVNSIG